LNEGEVFLGVHSFSPRGRKLSAAHEETLPRTGRANIGKIAYALRIARSGLDEVVFDQK
jgi:hypothetical protein